MEKQVSGVPEPTLRRLPLYYHYLKSVLAKGREHISCTHIGRDLLLEPVQIRKDLAFTGIRGLPKVGYRIKDLVASIEKFFGWKKVDEAFIVGAGNLGQALMNYAGFKRYGFKIVAAFDKDPEKIGKKINGIEILPIEKLENLCQRLNIKIGVLTVGEEQAQQIAETMIKGGIRAIWNFVPLTLKVPEEIIVENEVIAAGLAVLSKKLLTSLKQTP